LQKSLPAEADGAVHITPAAKAAAAPPTVAVNTLVFMLGFLFSGRPPHSAAAGRASRILGFQGESREVSHAMVRAPRSADRVFAD
jgi:hypothetical protein